MNKKNSFCGKKRSLKTIFQDRTPAELSDLISDFSISDELVEYVQFIKKEEVKQFKALSSPAIDLPIIKTNRPEITRYGKLFQCLCHFWASLLDETQTGVIKRLTDHNSRREKSLHRPILVGYFKYWIYLLIYRRHCFIYES